MNAGFHLNERQGSGMPAMRKAKSLQGPHSQSWVGYMRTGATEVELWPTLDKDCGWPCVEAVETV